MIKLRQIRQDPEIVAKKLDFVFFRSIFDLFSFFRCSIVFFVFVFDSCRFFSFLNQI